MSDFKWTKEQLLALRCTGGDLLLTAAAGAGKTAVLSQRCIHLLTDAKPRCNIDELLVLTYTEAAAAEMKRRIGNALYQRSRTEPGNHHLRRQLALLDKARISTIHSFCRSVLREFFYRIGIDPGFGILDADEAGLIRIQIANDLLEDCYDRAGNIVRPEQFISFAESFSSQSQDRQLINLLIRMNSFLDTLRDREQWISSWQDQQQAIHEQHPKKLVVVEQQQKIFRQQIDLIIRQLEFARKTISHFPKLDFYTAYITDELMEKLQTIQTLLGDEGFDTALEKIGNIQKFKRAPTRPKGLSNENIAPVKNLIDQAKSQFKSITEKLSVQVSDVLNQLSSTSGSVDLLINLHQEFIKRYQKYKYQQNMLDFSDLEHYCLKLLGDDGDGNNDVARQLNRRYKNILVDEYQDISPLQEAIIRRIADAGALADVGGDLAKNKEPSTLENRPNLFMVGDVKQSIYSFRQADPRIFLEKYHSFGPVDSAAAKADRLPGNRRIDLNRNFRSRREIINSINFIFSRCMTDDFGEIDYLNDAQLVYGADYYGQADGNDNQADSRSDQPAVELQLLERNLGNNHSAEKPASSSNSTEGADEADDQQDIDATRREAVMVARRIRQMVGADHPEGKAEFNILDSETKTSRPVQYSDIVILLRSMKVNAEIWNEIFHQMQVPLHAEMTTGFFQATEIQDMVNLLGLIDNPRQDIPLASVLRGPLVGLSESQLAAVRLHCPDESFYGAVTEYADRGGDEQLKQKLSRFFDNLNHWRSLARRGPLARLIWRIYRQNHLLSFVSGQNDGRQRYNNLLHLHDRARQFDTFANQGLSRFLRFLEKLREEDGDFAAAPVLTEADNVVRIMSIHKSKGLEFPVVIVGGLAKKFNKADSRHQVLFTQPENGCAGLRVVDSVSNDRWPTVCHNIIAETIDQKQLTEEMRILYVALTRAREKLLLFATVDLEKRQQQWQSWSFHRNAALPEFQLRSAQAPIDWLGSALAAHPDMCGFLGNSPESENNSKRQSVLGTESRFAVVSYSGSELAEILQNTLPAKRRKSSSDFSTDSLTKKDRSKITPELQKVIDRIKWQYPHQNLTNLPARTSVSELKRRFDFQQDPDFQPDPGVMRIPADSCQIQKPFDLKPRFLSDQAQTPSATEIGTLTHLLLQMLDFSSPVSQSEIARQLLSLQKEGFFTEQQARWIKTDRIAEFFESALGQEMFARRGSLQREWPFTLALPTDYLNSQPQSNKSAGNEPAVQERVLVRGIIDAFYESEAGITIIDFKTDRLSPEQCPLRARQYHLQMKLYQRAVQEILNKTVNQLFIYFLHPALAYSVPMNHELSF